MLQILKSIVRSNNESEKIISKKIIESFQFKKGSYFKLSDSVFKVTNIRFDRDSISFLVEAERVISHNGHTSPFGPITIKPCDVKEVITQEEMQKCLK